jgi:hypothetical protein
MSENIVLTFALLFSAVLTLIAAIYVALTKNRELKRSLNNYQEQQ